MSFVSSPSQSAVRSPAAVSPARVFWAAWAGWMLDGFDSAIYGFVLVGALTELLPGSGRPATQANIAFFGGMLFSIFMLGWACSMFWGWMADRIGRVRAMCWTIFLYSVFTAACGLTAGIASFAVFRFLSGFAIGGEWAAGTPLLHESVPETMRVRLAGWLHTATPTGITLAALVTFALLRVVGWRGMFLIGAAPALLALYLRLNIPEPERSPHRAPSPGTQGLFSGAQARVTWVAALMMACAIFGLWSSTFWVPTVVVTKLVKAGQPLRHAQTMAALTGVITNVGTFLGCLFMPWLTTLMKGRKITAAVFFTGALVTNVLAYHLVIGRLDNLVAFCVLLPVLGFFTNGIFALYTIWLPEMFPSALRGFGGGFAFSLGRVLGAAGPTIVGALAASTGSYPTAISLVSLIYLVALPCVAFAPETSRKPLPA